MKSIIVLFIWTTLAIYAGISGICKVKLEEDLFALKLKQEELLKKPSPIASLNNVPFDNEYNYKYYILIRQYLQIFPWFEKVPIMLGTFFTAMSFGLLGAIAKIILSIVKGQISPVSARIWSEPVLGIFVGIAVLGLSFVLPNILIISTDTIRPLTLMFLTFFCGLYAEKFFDILSNLFSKFFKT
jgi:hypothetical protein